MSTINAAACNLFKNYIQLISHKNVSVGNLWKETEIQADFFCMLSRFSALETIISPHPRTTSEILPNVRKFNSLLNVFYQTTNLVPFSWISSSFTIDSFPGISCKIQRKWRNERCPRVLITWSRTKWFPFVFSSVETKVFPSRKAAKTDRVLWSTTHCQISPITHWVFRAKKSADIFNQNQKQKSSKRCLQWINKSRCSRVKLSGESMQSYRRKKIVHKREQDMSKKSSRQMLGKLIFEDLSDNRIDWYILFDVPNSREEKKDP